MIIMACSSDSDYNTPIRREICFANPVINGMTRAGEVTGVNYPTDETFIVTSRKYKGDFKGWFATGTEEEINYEQKGTANPKDVVKYNATYNVWHTPEPHYWVEGYKYAFGAISPASLRNSNQIKNLLHLNTGFQIIDFKPSSTLSEHMDIMYSGRVYDKTAVTAASGVDIQFRHALSSIHFKVCVSPNFVKEMESDKDPNNNIKNGDYRIKSIKVTGINNCAVFKEQIDDVKGIILPPEWKLTSNVTEAEINKEYEFVSTEISLPADGTSASIADAAKDITVAEYKGYSAMLIPQLLNKDAAKVIITYTKNGNATKPTWVTKELILNNDITPYTTEWLMGYRYTYTIAFTSDVIYFSPNVTDMKEKDITIL